MTVTVGLTGGIGSGKSEVARLLAAHGALVVDADALAREALRTRYARAWPRWSRSSAATSCGRDGSLDRARLAPSSSPTPSGARPSRRSCTPTSGAAATS